MTFPPLPQPQNRDLEELMDALAYLLATSATTSGVAWILGDVGMGAPQALPYGYVSQVSESVTWYTAQGSQGGLGAGGAQGLDDWSIPVNITVCYQQHQYVMPSAASPANNAFSTLATTLATQGLALPYSEQPGWRGAQNLIQAVKGVLRQNIVVGGFATTSRVAESKPLVVNIDSKLYRAIRVTVQFQQRRRRGT